MITEKKKQEYYTGIKIAGFLYYIPFIMAGGPLTGLFVGMYLKNKFGIPRYVVYILIAIGFLAAIMEALRIIRRVNKMNKGLNGRSSS